MLIFYKIKSGNEARPVTHCLVRWTPPPRVFSMGSTFLSLKLAIDHLSLSRKMREGEDGERGSGLIDYTFLYCKH